MSRAATLPIQRQPLFRANRIGSLLVAFLLILAACGGGEPEPSATGATVAGAVEERADEASSGADDSADDSADDGADDSADGSGDGVTAGIAEAAADAFATDDKADDRSDSSNNEPNSGSASDTVPVTIEPPKEVPNTVPPATTGCEGAGFGESNGEVTTRIGVLVPDYSALIDTGFVPRVTPTEYRARYLASTFGANVRNNTSFPGSPFALPCGELELVTATYDPIDPATQRDACLALAEGPGVLVVLSELEDRRGEGLSCLLDEAGIPVVTAGSVTSDDLDDAAGKLVSLRPPVDLLGAGAVRTFDAMQLFEGQTVAVIGGDDPVAAATSQSVLAELDGLGVEAVSAILPSAKGVTDVWAEIPEMVEDFAADEVTVVISTFDAVVTNAIWDRMIKQEVSWQFLLVDATSVGEHDKVTRLPDEFNGLLYTSLESEKEADRTDPASVECIADYAAVVALLEDNPEGTGLTGDVPAFELPSSALPESPTTTVDAAAEGDDAVADGDADAAASDEAATEGPLEDSDDGIETSLREVLGEDRPPGPACALTSLAVQAILSAGDDLNAETFGEAVRTLGPLDLFIEGTGALAEDKFYLADFAHVLRFEQYIEPISEELAAPCDSPDNCWRQIDDPAAAIGPLLPTTSAGAGAIGDPEESADADE